MLHGIRATLVQMCGADRVRVPPHDDRRWRLPCARLGWARLQRHRGVSVVNSPVPPWPFVGGPGGGLHPVTGGTPSGPSRDSYAKAMRGAMRSSTVHGAARWMPDEADSERGGGYAAGPRCARVAFDSLNVVPPPVPRPDERCWARSAPTARSSTTVKITTELTGPGPVSGYVLSWRARGPGGNAVGCHPGSGFPAGVARSSGSRERRSGCRDGPRGDPVGPSGSGSEAIWAAASNLCRAWVEAPRSFDGLRQNPDVRCSSRRWCVTKPGLLSACLDEVEVRRSSGGQHGHGRESEACSWWSGARPRSGSELRLGFQHSRGEPPGGFTTLA